MHPNNHCRCLKLRQFNRFGFGSRMANATYFGVLPVLPGPTRGIGGLWAAIGREYHSIRTLSHLKNFWGPPQ